MGGWGAEEGEKFIGSRDGRGKKVCYGGKLGDRAKGSSRVTRNQFVKVTFLNYQQLTNNKRHFYAALHVPTAEY